MSSTLAALLVLSCTLSATGQVLYGQMITLRHTDSNKHLYSSATPNSHVNSSQQNQVVAVDFLDTSCRWRVLPAAGVELKSVDGKAVRDTDVIRLQHINTYKLLHSHAKVPSPVSERQEVTGFNEQEDTDSNDNWILRVMAHMPGQPWTHDVGVRLMHQSTGAKLYSEHGNVHPNYTSGYQEVAASQFEPEELHQNYEWMSERVAAACSGFTVDSCIRSADDGTGGGEGGSTITKEMFQKFLALFNQWDEERFKHINDDPNNTPKEISIYCPVNPTVNIQELDYSLQSNGDCLVLNIQSPHLEAKLTMKCNPPEKEGPKDEA